MYMYLYQYIYTHMYIHLFISINVVTPMVPLAKEIIRNTRRQDHVGAHLWERPLIIEAEPSVTQQQFKEETLTELNAYAAFKEGITFGGN